MPKTVKPASKFVVSFLELVSDPEIPKLTVLLGGGSIVEALAPAFGQMAELGRSWDNLTIGLTDERYSPDIRHPDANFTKLSGLDSMFQLQNQGMEIVPILLQDAALGAVGKHYNDFLVQQLADDDRKLVGVVGVGADFHTAGILPHKPEHEYLFHETLAVGYKADEISNSDNPHRERVTVTFHGLQKLHECWVYAVGESKRPVVEAITSVKQPVPMFNEKPALYLWELPELTIFTDQAA